MLLSDFTKRFFTFNLEKKIFYYTKNDKSNLSKVKIIYFNVIKLINIVKENKKNIDEQKSNAQLTLKV